MFHRPKDEKNTAAPAQDKKPGDAPVSSFGSSLRASTPSAPVKLDPLKAAPSRLIGAKAETPKDEPAKTDAFKTEPAKTETPASAALPIETPKAEEKTMADNNDKMPPAPARPLDIPGSASAYQTQPARVQSPVFGSPTAYSPVPAGQPNPNAAKPAGRRLVIGPGISLSGEIEACEFLVIEGTVEAALKGASVLEIAESGTFYGTVEIDEATVAGKFEGEITCNGRLTITSTGSVTGSIAYKELAIEAGATLDGKVNPLGGSKVGAKKPERVAKKSSPRNDNGDDNSVELPLTGTNNG